MQHELLNTIEATRSAVEPHAGMIALVALTLLTAFALWMWAGAAGRARRYRSERDAYGSALDAANAKAEKFKDQVKDTCSRAEQAESDRDNARKERDKAYRRVDDLLVEIKPLRELKARREAQARRDADLRRERRRASEAKHGVASAPAKSKKSGRAKARTRG